jgi:hypothetical protein
MYFLADAGDDGARYLSRLVAAAAVKKLLKIELRLTAGQWRFPFERTVQWLKAQFRSSLRSVERFRLAPGGVRDLEGEIMGEIDRWAGKWRERFPAAQERRSAKGDRDRAEAMVLRRTTLGMTMPPEIRLPERAYEEFQRTLYLHNLDLVFFRIVYWANGRRSLREIAELIELEMDEMSGETSISRTASGRPIEAASGGEIDMGALLFVVDVLIQTGFLREE